MDEKHTVFLFKGSVDHFQTFSYPPYSFLQCIGLYCAYVSPSQVALVVKNSPASAGDIRDASLIPGSGRSCEGRHGNPLAWRIPGTGEPGGLPTMGSHRVGHD